MMMNQSFIDVVHGGILVPIKLYDSLVWEFREFPLLLPVV